MLKKTIIYHDYDGNERKEDFYFNLSAAELVEWEYGVSGGMTATIQQMINTQDITKIMAMFKDIVMRSYGEKSVDGKRFMKVGADGRRLVEKFIETEAYSELFLELLGDPEKFNDFIAGIIPASTQEAVKNNVQALASAN